jgi:two-component system, NarL family, sensor histidine kinase UhpB
MKQSLSRSEPPAGASRYRPLLLRVFALNAFVVVAATVAGVAIVSPRRLSHVAVEEALVLAAALVATLALNLLLLSRALRPLERLTRMTRRVDGSRPGQRVEISGPRSDVTELAESFNEMLGRLELERRESTRRVLDAQEAERRRVAQELHDEVGQTLTAVLLQLSRTARQVPTELAAEVAESQETVRRSLEEVRRISRELRPEALDDLGLVSALAALTERLSEHAGLCVARQIERDLPPLDDEHELVAYRVAQEALTNAVRHAGARRVELIFGRRNGSAVLTVRDDGRGLGSAAPGGGISGMRERAALIGAQLSVGDAPGGGAQVTLDIPLGAR